MDEQGVKFVNPEEALTGYGNPIRIWKAGGGKKIIDDFIFGIVQATEDSLSYQDSRGQIATFNVSDGDRFEILPFGAAT